MNRKVYALTLMIQSICWSLVFGLLIAKANPVVQAKPLPQAVPASTPVPFLGPIYYGRQDIWNIFDHNLPWASIVDDGNDDVLHHDGTTYFAGTITPVPGATPTPTGWPTPAPYIPDSGYGYDQHGGIDYSLVYEPVLAAADGDVIVADWSDPSNHRKMFDLITALTPQSMGI
ncbi:MAG: hypothetical protein H6662_06435 [Ardenticatenaceae bacterium]|nr:hypothetical protein [Anaerolineales bacterium]MCB8921202.1 hypothetical protein [Ardenticatenaceae bacterium]MCB8992167.1 hypothetical protein [Ardenticatenaceae bacterium]MCB9004274.1 hypothetical protein [Ardenticatenaceae bacterium]